MTIKKEESKLIRNINSKIRELNKKGIPVIFFITGNYSTGKTFFTKKLFKSLAFYQTVNLGIVTKVVRFFRPDINMFPSNNKFFANEEWNNLFNKIIDNLISSYVENGVNVIFEGVQVDTDFLSSKPQVTGGIILHTDLATAKTRGKNPSTHFKRKVSDLKSIKYSENEKFKIVNNNQNKEDTFEQVLRHLDRLIES